jgi:radical SAM superfamily enzyme YgiQ (UPF0313 family)
MIKRVLLINSPRVADTVLNQYAGKNRFFEVYPPIGLLYLSAMIKRQLPGVEVKVEDLHLESIKQSRAGQKSDWEGTSQRWIEDFKPDMVGLSCMFGSSYDYVRRYGSFIREKYPSLVLVGGGVHITGLAKNGELDDFLDFVCLNEAEHSFCGLIRYLNAEHDDLSGVVAITKTLLRDGAQLSDHSETADAVDELPMPDWQQIDLRSYYKYGRLSASQTYTDDQPIATLLTERGCTARCTFCSVRNFNGFGVRGHSPQRVLEEIDILYNEHGVRHIDLLDDDFTFSKPRTLAILNGLIKRDYDLGFSMANGVRLGTLDDDILGAMVQAKVKYMSLGIESGDPAILLKVKKPLTLEILWKKLPLLHKYWQIYYRANFIVGFPDETPEQLASTFKLAQDMKVDWNLFSICKTLPNTEMYEDYVTQGKGTGKLNTKNEDYAFNAVTGVANTTMTGQSIFDQAYQKNLEINFRDNQNLAGRNVQRAITDFERVTTIADDHAVAWNCIAAGYKKLGKLDSAQRAADKARNIVSTSAEWAGHFSRIGMYVETVAAGASRAN